eukprot:jgi/Bigna1/54589/estExt_Genewise1Plus.C_380020
MVMLQLLLCAVAVVVQPARLVPVKVQSRTKALGLSSKPALGLRPRHPLRQEPVLSQKSRIHSRVNQDHDNLQRPDPTPHLDTYQVERRKTSTPKKFAMIIATTYLALSSGLIATAAEATEEITKKDGWFQSIINVLENSILGIDEYLHNMGVEQSTGLSIIIVTLIVRTLVLPLNFASLKSSALMQAISPRMKEIQAKYKDDQETQGALILQVYQKAGVNPLAGLVPAFAQIPIFIAFYRALSNLAKDDKLSESFFWLPSLEGPTFTSQNLDWLTKGWEGINPPLGWHDTLAYLALPALYVIGQSASQKLLAPPQPEGSENPAGGFTKFLPLLIGYFSLNVPSALILYWVVSNIYSVGSSLATRALLANDPKVAELKELMAAPMIIQDEEEETPDASTLFPPASAASSQAYPPRDISASSSMSSQTQEDRSSRGSRFRELKSKESGNWEEEVVEQKPESVSQRGAKFRELRAKEESANDE